MSTFYWFRVDDNQAVGFGSDAHLFLHGQGVYGGPAIIRARDMGSTSAADAELQRALARARARDQRLVDWRWQLYQHSTDALPLLARELAQALDGAIGWRRYADWAWRVGDPRGELVELHESLEQARHPQQRLALQRRLAAHEARHFGLWRERLIHDHALRQGGAGRLGFVRGHLTSVVGWPPADLNPLRQPLAIASLELSLDDAAALERLSSTLAMPAFAGLRRLRLQLQRPLAADDAATIFMEIRRRLSWLRELEIAGSPSAALGVDAKALAALRRLLWRHDRPVCGLGLDRLRLDLDDPVGGWTPALINELIAGLNSSILRGFELRAPTIPAALREWIEANQFPARLDTLRARERPLVRARVGEPSFARGPQPPRLGERGPALLVWADWLQTLGEPLGELAIRTAELGDHDPSFQPIRAAIEAELLAFAEPDAGLELDWRGPLIEHATIRRSERLLERLVRLPAAARLRSLRLESGPLASTADLRDLELLEIEQDEPLALAAILDALPELASLRCRAPGLRLGGHRPHTQLRELRLFVPADLDNRGLGRMLARIDPAGFPKLAVLALELAPRGRGAPLCFARLAPPPGAEVHIHGPLREQDADALLRQASMWTGGKLRIVDPQAPTVQRRLRNRAFSRRAGRNLVIVTSELPQRPLQWGHFERRTVVQVSAAMLGGA